jgi:hypothetical protein
LYTDAPVQLYNAAHSRAEQLALLQAARDLVRRPPRRKPGRPAPGRATLRLGWQALHQPADLADLTTEQWFQRVGMPAHAREALWDWLALGIAAEPVTRESAKVFANVLATGFLLGVKHYPAAEAAKVVQAQVVKMPKATFSQTVGMDSLRPPHRTSVPSLVLAGDWTATDWSATVESAVQSAAKAVELLLARPVPR